MRLCSILNTWKHILVVVVAVDRPPYPHVLRALQIELGNSSYRVTGLRVFVDACIFQPLQMPVRQPSHRFYHHHSRKRQPGILERRARLVPACGHMAPGRYATMPGLATYGSPRSWIIPGIVFRMGPGSTAGPSRGVVDHVFCSQWSVS